jgi:hypothetical protein
MICMPQQLKTKILFWYIHMFIPNCRMELLNLSDPSYNGWLEVHMFAYHCTIFSTVITYTERQAILCTETNMAPWNQVMYNSVSWKSLILSPIHTHTKSDDKLLQLPHSIYISSWILNDVCSNSTHFTSYFLNQQYKHSRQARLDTNKAPFCVVPWNLLSW